MRPSHLTASKHIFMKYTDFATYVRKKTKTDTVSLGDVELKIYANIAKDEVASAITEANEDYFGITEYRNLEAGKRNYALEGDILNNVKFVEAMVDGVKYKHLSGYDLHKMDIATDEASITSYMAGRKDGFFIYGGELFILSELPITDVTDGIKIWAMVFPADITDLTLTSDMSEAPNEYAFGIPKQFHELVARRTVIEYKNSQEKPMPLTEKELKYDADLKAAVNKLKGQNLDETIVPESPYDDGSNY